MMLPAQQPNIWPAQLCCVVCCDACHVCSQFTKLAQGSKAAKAAAAAGQSKGLPFSGKNLKSSAAAASKAVAEVGRSHPQAA